ncbi:MAG: SDR family NAD(P)-dependent oxidoreductase, partial [Planctomycetota bacterium]
TIAASLAAPGARVWLTGRSQDRVDAAVERLQAHQPEALVYGVACDQAHAGDCEHLMSELEKAGGCQVLINNAVDQAIGPGLLEMEEGFLQQALAVNVIGVFRLSRLAAKQMQQAGSGSIVNVGSLAGERALLNRGAYVTSKGGLDALTRAMALEWAPLGIRVNIVAPGYIRTSRWNDLPETDLKRRLLNTPTGEAIGQQQVADACCYLASPQARGITGARLVIDGGVSIQHVPADCAV